MPEESWHQISKTRNLDGTLIEPCVGGGTERSQSLSLEVHYSMQNTWHMEAASGFKSLLVVVVSVVEKLGRSRIYGVSENHISFRTMSMATTCRMNAVGGQSHVIWSAMQSAANLITCFSIMFASSTSIVVDNFRTMLTPFLGLIHVWICRIIHIRIESVSSYLDALVGDTLEQQVHREKLFILFKNLVSHLLFFWTVTEEFIVVKFNITTSQTSLWEHPHVNQNLDWVAKANWLKAWFRKYVCWFLQHCMLGFCQHAAGFEAHMIIHHAWTIMFCSCQVQCDHANFSGIWVLQY